MRCFNRINERYGNVTTTGEITILGKNIYDDERVAQRTAQDGRHGLSASQSAADLDLRERAVRRARPYAPRRTSAAAERDEMVEAALREVQLWDDVKDKLQERPRA